MLVHQPLIRTRFAMRISSLIQWQKFRVTESFISRHDIDMLKVDDSSLPDWDEILSLIPGQCSDFAGWKANIKEWWEKRQQAKEIPAGSLGI